MKCVLPRKPRENKCLETGLHSPSRQARYRAAVKDAVSLLDMVVLETPEHTAPMTKETKSWMHFLRLLVRSLSSRVYGGGPPWDGYVRNAGIPTSSLG